MLERAIRSFAIAASAFVALGFVLFAVDSLRDASDRQVSAVVDPSAREERAREAQHSGIRNAVDDVDDALLAPFAAFGGDSSNSWVARGLPTLVALLIYGLGLGYLANWIRARA